MYLIYVHHRTPTTLYYARRDHLLCEVLYDFFHFFAVYGLFVCRKDY